MNDDLDDQSAEPAQSKPEMDRRSVERRKGQRRTEEKPVAVERRSGADRRAGQRRTRRGPNQYELEQDELEFINAINRFKESSGRAFPTWSEVLGILKELGYEKQG